MELRGEDLACYSNKIKSVCLRKCLYDRKLINKAYLDDIAATNIIRVLPTRWRRKPFGIDMERNYVTNTLCIVASRRVATGGMWVYTKTCEMPVGPTIDGWLGPVADDR